MRRFLRPLLWTVLALAGGSIALAAAALAWVGLPHTGAGLAAKALCSGVFVAGRRPDEVLRADLLPASPLLRLVTTTVDESGRRATATMLWSGRREARLVAGLGCVLEPTPALVRAAQAAAAEATTADRSAGTTAAPWPATDGSGIDRAALQAVADDAFRNDGASAGRNTRALLILHRGRLVLERYAPGFDAGTRQLGWSMTKTLLGMLTVKRLAEQGLPPTIPVLDWARADRRPAWLEAWRGDERARITVADLLYMRDGLAHEESYAPWSAVPRMLWGAPDVGAFAGSAPSEAPAGTRWRYLSTTTNLLSALLRLQFPDDASYWRYLRKALLEPIGATSLLIESDSTGTLVASSYGWATARDFARIGQLILQRGLGPDGRRVLPQSWWPLATVAPPSRGAAGGEDASYGAQLWLAGHPAARGCNRDAGAGPHDLPPDTLMMSGHWGQFTVVIPSRDAVVVRLGMTTDRTRFDRCDLIRRVAAALPPA